MPKKLCTLTALICLSSAIMAGGFQLNNLGLKSGAMGGSFTGWSPDASVSFFNPGALTALEHNMINAGVNIEVPRSSFLGNSGLVEDMKSTTHSTFSLYGAYKMNAKNTLALSINSPYGSSNEWDSKWSGRFISSLTRINTIYFQPVYSHKFNDHVSGGIGPVLAVGNIRVEKSYPYSSQSGNESSAVLKAHGNGFGFNAGLYISSGKLSFGADYRSPVRMSLNNGNAVFADVPASVLNGGILPSSTSFKTKLNFPGVLSAGASYKLNLKLSFTFDINYTFWKSFEELQYQFPDYPSLNFVTARNYTNAVAIRAGIQSAVSSKLTIRGGVAYDESPVPDHYLSPDLVDANKFILSGGFSYVVSSAVALEGTFMFEDVKERRETGDFLNNFNGTYKSINYIAGVGAQFTF